MSVVNFQKQGSITDCFSWKYGIWKKFIFSHFVKFYAVRFWRRYVMVMALT